MSDGFSKGGVTMSDELIIHSGGRRWRRVGEREHMTRDGGRVVAVWESPCLICGEPFTITTSPGITSVEQSNSFSVMTCREHRLWPMESQKIWLAKPEDRREVFEEIKRKKLAFVPRSRARTDPSTWRRRRRH
jgi:hypothetical protein